MSLLQAVHWVVELGVSWLPQAGLVAASLAVLSRRRRLFWLFALVAVLGLVAVGLRAARAPRDLVGPHPEIELLVLNVQMEGTGRSTLLAELHADPPDVVVLIEVDQAWVDSLEAGLGGLLPHRAWHPDGSRFGLGVLSAFPFEAEAEALHPHTAPSLTARFADWTLVAAHALPPLEPQMMRARDAQLALLAERMPARRAVLVGDLNTAPWSPSFGPLVHLRDAGARNPVSGSWPSWTGALGTPIDHVLVTPDVGAHAHRVVGGFGSDHRAVRVVIDLPVGGAPER